MKLFVQCFSVLHSAYALVFHTPLFLCTNIKMSCYLFMLTIKQFILHFKNLKRNNFNTGIWLNVDKVGRMFACPIKGCGMCLLILKLQFKTGGSRSGQQYGSHGEGS